MSPKVKNALTAIGISGVIAVMGFVFGAGKTAEGVTRDLSDHGQRLDKIEPKVEELPGIKQEVQGVKQEVRELHQDVREIRDHLLGPRPPR